MHLSERMPTGLRIALINGTATWDSLPYRVRLYYESGARGGPADHDDGEGSKLSVMPSAGPFHDDTQEAMYADALDQGATQVRNNPAIEPQQMPDMNKLPATPVGPAATGVIAVQAAISV